MGTLGVKERRSQYDVTNRICVTSPDQVSDAVRENFLACYPDHQQHEETLRLSMRDFALLFHGLYPGYLGCDTLYHDMQHTLDMCLAMSRLLRGYESSEAVSLGPDAFVVGIVSALFHDSGYIRKIEETEYENGAEFTKNHVSRSAEFLRQYLPKIGLGGFTPIATQLVHYTGYEIRIEDIKLPSPIWQRLGELLGTSDMMAQMADRCYLEKCRDRLYPEFVVGGITRSVDNEGKETVVYASAEDLLSKTPGFYHHHAKARLEEVFHSAFRYIEPLYGGQNPYMDAIHDNITHLEALLANDSLHLIRRRPPHTRGQSLFPMSRVA